MNFSKHPKRIGLLSSSKFVLISVLLACAGSTANAKAPGPNWKIYVNARFSYIACYPAALLTAQGEAPDGDGQAFLGAHGAKLLVYGGFNMDNHDPRASLAATINRLRAAGGIVSAAHHGPGFFTLSGIQGGSIIEEKRLFNGVVYQTLRLSYPAREQSMFKPLLAHMIKCFVALTRKPT